VVQLDRLRGQLTERAEASLDGKTFRPGSEFIELKSLLTSKPARAPAPAPAAAAAPARERAPSPPGAPQIGPALRALFGDPEKASPPPPPPAPAQPAAVVAPEPESRAAPPPPPPPPSGPEKLEMQLKGELGEVSPLRLYALAAATGATGRLDLRTDTGKSFSISFRRGAPEHLASDDPELSILRFLQSRKVLDEQQVLKADEHARTSGTDAVTTLFQLQLIPPADAHRWMSEHARFVLDRALECWRGTFVFHPDLAPPPAGFPLGQKWALLAEAVRRLDPAPLRARMSRVLAHPAVRSGGLAIGKVEELALNAQEARLYALIDGTKTGDELLKQFDGALALRLFYLLSELKHLSFGEAAPEEAAPPAADAAAAVPAAASAPAAAAAPVATAPAAVPPTPVPQPPAPKPVAAPKPPPKTAAPPRPAPAPPKPAAPAPRPIANFAAGPAGETPQAALVRLRGLVDKIEKGTHYEALGLDKKATSADVKRAFVLLARDLHPDTVTDPAQGELRNVKEHLFGRVNEAAQVLGDDERRKEYEAELKGEKKDVDVGRIFDAEEKFQKAEIFVKARKYKEGLQLLEEAIELNPEEAEFYAWRGYARFLLAADRKSAFEECAADCRKAIKMIERCVAAHLFLGHMQKIVGDLKSAGSSFGRVLQYDDRNVEAQRELRLMGKK
jgi:hypothetical protein